MSQRKWSWVIGGGVALLALVLVLSTVPVVVHTGKSTESHIEASSGADTHACVLLTFDATFDYSLARPLLDLWGFVEIRDLTIDHVKLTGSSDPECMGVTPSVGHVTDWVVLPSCDRDFSEAAGLVQSGMFTECDGHAVVYAAEAEPGATEVTMGYEGPLDLPRSGLVRGPWCPEFWAQFTASSIASGGIIDNGDLCLDLS